MPQNKRNLLASYGEKITTNSEVDDGKIIVLSKISNGDVAG